MLPENVKTSFLYGNNIERVLFKNAFHFAEDGRNVWFISPEPIKQLPNNVVPPDKEVLKLITFLYLKDFTELIKHINGIHVWYKVPELIILNDFHSYVGLYSDSFKLGRAAFLCASLLDAAAACGRKLSKTVCSLVACHSAPNANSKLQVIVDLYFQNVINSTDDNKDYIIG